MKLHIALLGLLFGQVVFASDYEFMNCNSANPSLEPIVLQIDYNVEEIETEASQGQLSLGKFNLNGGGEILTSEGKTLEFDYIVDDGEGLPKEFSVSYNGTTYTCVTKQPVVISKSNGKPVEINKKDEPVTVHMSPVKPADPVNPTATAK